VRPTLNCCIDIDSNILSLVETLNALPGFRTEGSCGGHVNPSNAQHEAGTWFVSFRVAPSRGGWRSLEFLAGLTGRYDVDQGVKQNGNVEYRHTVMTEVNSPSSGKASRCTGRSLRVFLKGVDGVDPEDVARAIRAGVTS